MWTISLPLFVQVSRNKRFHLNLNPYRNAHHFILDKAKKEFYHLVKNKLQGIPRLDKCTLEYTLFPPTAQLCDTNNICCIVDKFFSDTLVTRGVIEDDNYNFVIDTRFKFGHIDRVNPRVDVVISSPDHIPLVPPEPLENKPMKIQTKTVVLLSFLDVVEAFKAYLETKISLAPDANFTIGEEPDGGFRIEIEQASSDPSEAKPKSRRKVDRMEPKEAMQALKDKEPGPVVEATGDVQDALPVVGEELGHVDQAPTVPSLFAKAKAVEAAPEEVPAKTSPLFAGFKRPSNP
jgi:hypothetical protein